MPVPVVARRIVVAHLLDTRSEQTACDGGPQATEQVRALEIGGKANDDGHHGASAEMFDIILLHNRNGVGFTIHKVMNDVYRADESGKSWKP